VLGPDAIGLKGVGVLPGPLRKVIGVSKLFSATTDFKGEVVGIQDSGVAESTLRAFVAALLLYFAAVLAAREALTISGAGL